MALLGHAEPKVRIAALSVCNRYWDCSLDPRFLATCRAIAATDGDDGVRGAAVDAIGATLAGTRDASASRFLADIATDDRVSDVVRERAYFALRAIQFGFSEQDLAARARGLVRELVRRVPPGDEARFTKAAALRARLPLAFDAVPFSERIDWAFVRQFAGEAQSQTRERR